MESGDIKRKLINGSSWTVFSNISSQAITFGVTVLLARLLAPSDFGVVAISSVFTGVVMLFQDLGMGAALIQRRDIDDDYLSTSFFVSIIAGVVLALLLAGAAPFVAAFYGEEVLRDILLVSSLGFVLSPFTSIHTSILAKRLEFKRLSLLNLASHALTGLISALLALAGYGVWSLVLGKVVAQPLMVPVVWGVVRWRPRRRFVWGCFKDLFGFSSNLLTFNIFNFFARNLDNLIIGKFLGSQALGYYSVAYNLMLKPLQLVSWSIGKVLFPVFSSIQGDMKRTREVYLKVVRSISLVTFPMMTGLYMVSEEFMTYVYGPSWEPAILPLKLLCIVGAIQSIGTTGGTIFNSQGRSDLTLKVGTLSAVAIMAAFLIGIRWGLLGLIAAYIAVSVPVFLVGQYFANGLIGLRMREFVAALAPAAACSAVMVAVLGAFSLVNGAALRLGMGPTLSILVVLGAISYLLLAAKVFKVPEVTEALMMVRRRL